MPSVPTPSVAVNGLVPASNVPTPVRPASPAHPVACAGVMRPEILVPLEPGENEDEVDPTLAREAGLLELGTTVRVIRDPYFGLLGEVSALPTEPAVLGSGSRARVLEVRFPGGDTAVVPRANVELIEG